MKFAPGVIGMLLGFGLGVAPVTAPQLADAGPSLRFECYFVETGRGTPARRCCLVDAAVAGRTTPIGCL